MKINDRPRTLSYAQGALNILGTLLSFGAWQGINSPALLAVQCLSLLSGATTIALVRISGKTWTERRSSLAFLINILPVCAMLWLNHAEMALKGAFWTPFEPHKLSVMAIAILAPAQWWIGLHCIAIFTGAALLQWFLFPATALQHMPHDEPWAMLAFAVFAGIVYVARVHDRRLLEQSAREIEETKRAAKLAEILLAIRDLANTPIQTLLIDVEFLKGASPDLEAISKRMGHSLQKLQHLNSLLAASQDDGKTRPELASLDARKILSELSEKKSL